MKIRLIVLGVLCMLGLSAARAIEYPDSYCEEEAWSFSMPGTVRVHTYGKYKVGDYYYYILDEEKKEAAIVSKEKVFETCSTCQVACLMPSVIDWPKGTFEGDIEVPSEVEIEGSTYSVVMIGYGVFYGCENLRSVKIPDSVRFISSYVFRGCSNLVEVSIPAGTYVGPDLFFECNQLKEIDYSKCKACDLRFYRCENLEVIKLPLNIYAKGPYPAGLYLGGENLKEIWCPEVEPPYTYVESHLEKENFDKLTLYVPRGSAQSYREAWGWNKFKNIVEYDLEGTDGIDIVEPEDGKAAEYYDLNGRRIAEPENGIFIRRSGEKSEKVLIRK